MKSSSTRFLIAVTAVTLVCAGLQAFWNMQMPARFSFPMGYTLLGVFFLSVTAIHLFLLNAAGGEPQAFIRKYLASTVIKFMFYIFLLIVLLLFLSGDKRILILHYLFYYAVFTVLEVSFLYGEMRKLMK